MADIHQFKLAELFSDPADLYDRLVSRKGYFPKPPTVEFDAELVSTGWTTIGCAIFAVMVHHEKRAYVILLDPIDLTAMRDALEQVHTALNLNALANAGRRPSSPFGSGR